ncbi:MAG TPA: PAS domain S-box protein [Planctomycetaceae bacterium]|jgi:PAS domain S-box-containing protein|nr:PAS domain S-box protein [Planctomycetaceae bacterium]
MSQNQPDQFARIGLQLVLEQLPVAVWTTDRELRITFSAGAALAMLGLETDELVGTTLADYLRTGDPEHPSLLRHRRAIAGESQIYDRELEGRHLKSRLEPLRQADGSIVGCIGISFDVTEQVASMAAARRSDERFQAFMKHLPALAWIKDDRLRYVYINRPFEQHFRVTLGDWQGRTDEEIWPSVAGQFRENDQRVLGSGQTIEAIEAVPDTLGNIRQWLVYKFPIQDGEGTTFVGGVGVDLTDRLQAETALAESEAKYRLLFHSVPQPIFIYDVETLRIREVNDAAVRQYGYSHDEFLSMTMKDIRPAEEVPKFLEFLDTAPAHMEKTGVWLHRRKDGTVFPAEVAVHLLDLASRPTRLVLANDISERLRAQEELERAQDRLRQSQKLEAIGGLAGGIAHDFNNLLTVILTFSDVLTSQLPPAAPMYAELQEINRAARRAADLVRQLLAVGRRQILAPRVLNLNAVIDEMERMLRLLIGENILLDASLDSALGPVEADPTQVEQVVLNLALNARDAMPTGGRLTIETRNVAIAARRGGAFSELPPGAYVRLTVSDTGCGMDEQTKARIFEPFFTTKEPGRGTGMGLATVYGIIRQSRGHVTVDSQPGEGTTFKIYLPRTDAESKRVKEIPTQKRDIPTGTETILLVEDEPVIRDLAKSVLRRCGYEILEASDGRGALEQASRHEGPLHLLITDVAMPHLGGSQLAQQLKRSRPEMKVLFISGYAEQEVIRHGIHTAETPLLQKPFFLSTLASKVREVLDH